jgi:hypothetical protein
MTAIAFGASVIMCWCGRPPALRRRRGRSRGAARADARHVARPPARRAAQCRGLAGAAKRAHAGAADAPGHAHLAEVCVAVPQVRPAQVRPRPPAGPPVLGLSSVLPGKRGHGVRNPVLFGFCQEGSPADSALLAGHQACFDEHHTASHHSSLLSHSSAVQGSAHAVCLPAALKARACERQAEPADAAAAARLQPGGRAAGPAGLRRRQRQARHHVRLCEAPLAVRRPPRRAQQVPSGGAVL